MLKRTAPWLLLATFAVPVWAGAPMATEDADVLAARECEWETTAERQRATGQPSASGLGSKLGCGLLDGVQLALGYARTRAEQQHADSAALSGKWALLPRPEGGFGLTLAWEVASLKAPGGSHRYDSRSLALVATQGLGGSGLVHLNLGHARSRLEQRSERFWALGFEWAANDSLDLLAETYGAQRGKPVLGLGLRWAAGESWSLGAMASRTRENPRSTGLLLSARLGF